MTETRSCRFILVAALALLAIAGIGCSQAGSSDPDAPAPKKPGSIPPPTDLPKGLMKKTGS